MEGKKVLKISKVGRFFRSVLFWEIVVISIMFAIVGLIYISQVRQPMTEKDLSSLVRLEPILSQYHYDLSYSIPFEMNLIFGWLWVMIIYAIFIWRWLTKQLGTRRMQSILGFILIFIGLAVSLLFGGMMYGLIVSLLFLLILSPVALIIFLSYWFWQEIMIKLFWEKLGLKVVWEFITDLIPPLF